MASYEIAEQRTFFDFLSKCKFCRSYYKQGIVCFLLRFSEVKAGNSPHRCAIRAISATSENTCDLVGPMQLPILNSYFGDDR